MQERIQKIISAAGVTSRRAAEELIAEGRVRLNGQVVTELGTKADPAKDHIKVDGKLINPRQPLTYIMLNKPAGYVTTMSDPEGRPTVQDLLKGVKVRVYPVGRLDYNTEGMLILTNDGDFAHLVTHPKHELPKTYLAKVKGVLDDKAIDALEQGVYLDDGKTAPAKIKKVRKEEANSWVEITIHEGRKRQVRRMFDRVGRSVIRLKRIKTGTLTLGDLQEGKIRYLSPDEVMGLRELAQNTDHVAVKAVARRNEGPGARGKGPGIATGTSRPMTGSRAGGYQKSAMSESRQRRPLGMQRPEGAAGGRRPGVGTGTSRPRNEGPGAGVRGPGIVTGTSRPMTGSRAGGYQKSAMSESRQRRPLGMQRPEGAAGGRRPGAATGTSRPRNEGPGSRGKGPGASMGSFRPKTISRETGKPGGIEPRKKSWGSAKPAAGSVKSRVRGAMTMHDTRDGRRKNQAPGTDPSRGTTSRRAEPVRSGPRPNKSVFTGGKRPARGAGPGAGGRRPGR